MYRSFQQENVNIAVARANEPLPGVMVQLMTARAVLYGIPSAINGYPFSPSLPAIESIIRSEEFSNLQDLWLTRIIDASQINQPNQIGVFPLKPDGEEENFVQSMNHRIIIDFVVRETASWLTAVMFGQKGDAGNTVFHFLAADDIAGHTQSSNETILKYIKDNNVMLNFITNQEARAL